MTETGAYQDIYRDPWSDNIAPLNDTLESRLIYGRLGDSWGYILVLYSGVHRLYSR